MRVTPIFSKVFPSGYHLEITIDEKRLLAEAVLGYTDKLRYGNKDTRPMEKLYKDLLSVPPS